jgi:S1-C subfamily serine protease
VLGLACLFLLPGEIETIDTPDFSKEVQRAAVCATVRITNSAENLVGTGIILGRKGPAVFVLTAFHVVAGANRLEVATFSPSTYPVPARRYRSVKVIAFAEDTRDLALLRFVTEDPLPGSLPLCPARVVPEKAGFKALTVGCADGAAPSCAVDEVTDNKKVRRESSPKAAFFWEVARSQDEGRSGGPLVDKSGRLIGVCSGNSKEKSYYCHPDEVRAFLIQNGFEG